MSLKEIIRRDETMPMIEKNYIRFSDFDLPKKFELVNRSLFAINLGLCGFEPRVAYYILKLEKVGSNIILIYYISRGKRLLYQLPERYANVISDLDIALINSGAKKYNIIRTIRQCDETRLHYHHKSYTWDLEIFE